MAILFWLKKQKGISLILALMMVTLVMFIVSFASSLSVGQLKFTGSSTDSSRAFTAADAGIEYALSRIDMGLAVGDNATSCQCGVTWCPSTPLESNAQFCVTADNPSSPRRVTAVGRTTDTHIRRSLEILLPVFAAVDTLQTVCFDGDGSAQSLNTICTNVGYSGATGMVGINTFECTASPAAALNDSPTRIARSDRVFTTGGTNYYSVQCYQ